MNRTANRVALLFSVFGFVVSGCSMLHSSRLSRAERYELLRGACSSGDLRCVEILLERGADPNGGPDWESDAIGGRFGTEFTSPLTAAAAGGHVEVMKLLLRHGALVDVLEGEGHTPLSMAISFKQKEAVELLLSAGANPATPMVTRMVTKCSDAAITSMVAAAAHARGESTRDFQTSPRQKGIQPASHDIQL